MGGVSSSSSSSSAVSSSGEMINRNIWSMQAAELPTVGRESECGGREDGSNNTADINLAVFPSDSPLCAQVLLRLQKHQVCPLNTIRLDLCVQTSKYLQVAAETTRCRRQRPGDTSAKFWKRFLRNVIELKHGISLVNFNICVHGHVLTKKRVKYAKHAFRVSFPCVRSCKGRLTSTRMKRQFSQVISFSSSVKVLHSIKIDFFHSSYIWFCS